MRTLYVEIEGLEDKPEIIIADSKDFLPIVEINDDEEAVNAIYSIKTCTACEKQILDLGNDFDQELKKYNIPEIVIAKTSTSYIPLKNIQGYDGSFVDDDGVLEFKCNNPNVKLRLLDESEPSDCGTNTKVYDLGDAELGDEYVLEISHSLERGAKFNIEVKASDENDGFWGKSDKVVVCGKLNFTVIERDVFLEDEMKIMKDFLISNARNYTSSTHMDCITTVNHAIRLLFKKNNLVLSDRMTRTMNKLDGYGMVKAEFTIDYLDISNKICKRNTPFKAKKMQNSLFKQIDKLISCQIGYHIFGVAIMDGYHSMILTVNNIEPCKKQYILSDQNLDSPPDYNYTSGWKEFKNGKELDDWITHKTVTWHSQEDSYAGTLLWKLQR